MGYGAYGYSRKDGRRTLLPVVARVLAVGLIDWSWSLLSLCSGIFCFFGFKQHSFFFLGSFLLSPLSLTSFPISSCDTQLLVNQKLFPISLHLVA